MNIAINGFGRIGRGVFKAILEKRGENRVVAINDLTNTATLAHLLKYDSIYGVYKKPVTATKEGITVGGKKYKVFAEKDPAMRITLKGETDYSVSVFAKDNEKDDRSPAISSMNPYPFLFTNSTVEQIENKIKALLKPEEKK